MVQHSFVVSDEARTDLDEIWHYVAQNNLVAADKLESKFLSAMQTLADSPHIGHLREDITTRPVRFWTVGAYAIIYLAESSPLKIIRILRWSRNIPSTL